MALDKQNTNIHYLLGRYVAVVERSNNRPLSIAQWHNIQSNTACMTYYDRNKTHFADVRMEIMDKVGADVWPKAVLADKGMFMLGYCHQKAELPMLVEKVERHTPDRVEPVDSNEIDQLRDGGLATPD